MSVDSASETEDEADVSMRDAALSDLPSSSPSSSLSSGVYVCNYFEINHLSL